MRNWIFKFMAGATGNVSNQGAPRKLGAEQLEARRLLTTGLDLGSFAAAGGAEIVSSHSAAIDAAGNHYMAGSFYGGADFDLKGAQSGNADILTARGATDAFVAKYNANGDFQWVRRMGGDSTSSINDVVREVKVDSAGNVYIAGHFAENADFGASSLVSQGARDGFAAKLDSSGNILWVEQWGGLESQYTESAVLSADGSFTVSSRASVDSAGLQPQQAGVDVIRFDASGNTLWSQLRAGRLNASRLAETPAGSLVLAGAHMGTVDLDAGVGTTIVEGPTDDWSIYVTQMDSNGAFEWANQIKADTVADPSSRAWFPAIDVNSSGQIALLADVQGIFDVDALGAGRIQSSGTTEKRLFAKYDNAGQLLVTTMHDDDPYFGESLVSRGDSYYVSGPLPSSGVFAPSSDVQVDVGPNKLMSVFVMEMDSQGNPVAATAFAGNGNEVGSLYASADGNLVLSLRSSATELDLDPDPINESIHYNSSRIDSFAIKLNVPAAGQPVAIFGDSFEYADGRWTNDTQNDWGRSTQRSTHGNWSLEVDGYANNAGISLSNPINLSGYSSAELTFDWLIENGFDSGEYLALDLSNDGGSTWQNDVLRLNGNQDAENVWHSESVDLNSFLSVATSVRFRSKVSSSSEDANVDNFRITGVRGPTVPNLDPTAIAGNSYVMNEGGSLQLDASGSSDSDGTIVEYAWDLDNDGQYDDAFGAIVNYSTTDSGSHTVGLLVTDNRGGTSIDTATVQVNNVAPAADAGDDQMGSVGQSLALSAAGSTDPGIDIVDYAWDLDGDGQYDDASGVDAVFAAVAEGTFSVGLRVTDADGASTTDATQLTINSQPTSSVVFEDSFENGTHNNDWNGLWVEDSQNDFFRSTQRSTQGAYSAEVDGYAGDATLTFANSLNLSSYTSATLTFDWLIEKGFDYGEYLSLDISSDGGATWNTNVRQLRGNVDAENTWHAESVDMSSYLGSQVLLRFRSLVSSSREDANIDNIHIEAM